MSITISNKMKQGKVWLLFLAAFMPLTLWAANEPKIQSSPQAIKPAADKSAAQQKPLPVAVPDVIFGQPDAPITIIEYSSLTCAACGHFHRTVFPHIKSKYIDQGHVKFIFRHFPTDEHAAGIAAIVCCAPEIVQAHMIQKLFEQQSTWLQAVDPVKEISQITGIKLELCKHAVQSEPLKEAVFMKRLQAEKELTIDGTPTFVINGRVIDHAPTLQVMESYLGPLSSPGEPQKH